MTRDDPPRGGRAGPGLPETFRGLLDGAPPPVEEDYPGDVPFLLADDRDGEGPEGAHPSFRVDDDPEAVERVWRTVWLPLLTNGLPGYPADAIMARIKGELYDYAHLCEEARKVYRHVTGGVVDRLDVSGEAVIATADHRIASLVAALRQRAPDEAGDDGSRRPGIGEGPESGCDVAQASREGGGRAAGREARPGSPAYEDLGAGEDPLPRGGASPEGAG